MTRKKIIIIGAGAKAAAIVARAAVMTELEIPGVPDIVVIEKSGAGAAWANASGYTDGIATLCTPPEMDVGFPYLSTAWDLDELNSPDVFNRGRDIARRLQERFSWQRFLLDEQSKGKISADSAGLIDYVLRGRAYPSHAAWAEYLRWVFAHAAHTPTKGKVIKAYLKTQPYPSTGASGHASRWVVEYKRPDDTTSAEEGDAVVLTGTGDPELVPYMSGGPPEAHFLHAGNFWDYVDYFRRLATTSPEVTDGISILVIGAGGAAATILAWLGETFRHTRAGLQHISTLGGFFPRGDGFAERQWLANPNSWQTLSFDQRRDIVRRTDAGVITANLKSQIDSIEGLISHVGRVARIDWESPRDRSGKLTDGPKEFRVWLENTNKSKLVAGVPGEWEDRPYIGRTAIAATHIVQAIGFDAWSLLKYIHDPGGATQVHAQPYIDSNPSKAARSLRSQRRQAMEEKVTQNLAISSWPDPGARAFSNLHIPALAGMVGPGFSSLTALGLTAARILDPYVVRG